jgi:hypothetical protein
LTSSFEDFAGSPENSAALVNGLRTGSAITLTDPNVPPGSTTPPATTTFSPGTKPMGFGNIRIALSLARAQLASQGITNPTPIELQGALVGTSGATGTATQGVLQMRASGMGWGQIANSMGVKLGAVMSGWQTFPTAGSTNSTTTAAGTSTSSSAATAQTRSRSGIVTSASGTSIGAANASHGMSGITTASGSVGGGVGSAATGLDSGRGNASSGAVTASGGHAGGGTGVSNAGGVGRGRP